MHPGFDRQPCDVAGLMCCLVNSNNDVLSKVWVRPPEDPMESPINQSERTELSTVEPTELPTIVEQLTGLNSYHVSIRLPDAMLACWSSHDTDHLGSAEDLHCTSNPNIKGCRKGAGALARGDCRSLTRPGRHGARSAN